MISPPGAPARSLPPGNTGPERPSPTELNQARETLQRLAWRSTELSEREGAYSSQAEIAPRTPSPSRSESSEAPYPEAPLASRRADFKPPKRVKDKGVYAEFHAQGFRCLHCTSTIVQAAHLLRGIKREDVLEALIPLCRFCHEAFDTARNVYYPIFVSVAAVKASVARHLRSAAGEKNAAYLIRTLGPFGAEDYVLRLEAA